MLARALGRFVVRSFWSTAMAVLGIALGVMSVVSVHIVTAEVASELEALTPREFADLTHFLHQDDLSADEYFELRARWHRGAYPDIEFLTPVIDEPAVIDGQSVRVLGLDLIGGGFTRLDFTSGTADPRGVWVDDTLAGRLDLNVNGSIEAPDVVLADIGVAQQLLGWPADRLSYVATRIRDPIQEVKDYGEHLLPGLGAGWPETRPEVDLDDTWRLLSAQQQNPASQFGKSVLFNLSALAMLGVLVAWFLIYQVAVAWLRRLWPTLERFHLLGVGMTVLVSSFVLTLVTLALVAGVIGTYLGEWLAEWLFAQATGASGTDLAVNGWVLLKAFGSALFVAVGGGCWAVWRRNDTTRTYAWLTWFAALILVGLTIWGVVSAETGLAGAFLSIATLSVISMLIVRPWLEWSRRRAGWLKGPLLWVLGFRETVWHPGDLTVAIGGLGLAVATAIGVGLMVDSFRADFDRFLTQRLSYEVVVEGPKDALRVFSHDRARDNAETQVYREGEIRVGGVPTELRVADLNVFEAARYGHDGVLSASTVLVSEQLARTASLEAGDSFTVAGVTSRVAGVFPGFGDIAPRLVVDESHPLAMRATEVDSIALRHMDAGERARAGVAYPDLRFIEQTTMRDQALATFDQTFVITGILITIALLVAGIGIYVATTSLRLNRMASARLLTSMGVSSSENLGIDLARAAGTAGAALGIALPLGILFGWILCRVINPRAFGWTVELALNPAPVLEPLGWGLLAALLAGVVRFGSNEESQTAG